MRAGLARVPLGRVFPSTLSPKLLGSQNFLQTCLVFGCMCNRLPIYYKV